MKITITDDNDQPIADAVVDQATLSFGLYNDIMLSVRIVPDQLLGGEIRSAKDAAHAVRDYIVSSRGCDQISFSGFNAAAAVTLPQPAERK